MYVWYLKGTFTVNVCKTAIGNIFNFLHGMAFYCLGQPKVYIQEILFKELSESTAADPR